MLHRLSVYRCLQRKKEKECQDVIVLGTPLTDSACILYKSEGLGGPSFQTEVRHSHLETASVDQHFLMHLSATFIIQANRNSHSFLPIEQLCLHNWLTGWLACEPVNLLSHNLLDETTWNAPESQQRFQTRGQATVSCLC